MGEFADRLIGDRKKKIQAKEQADQKQRDDRNFIQANSDLFFEKLYALVKELADDVNRTAAQHEVGSPNQLVLEHRGKRIALKDRLTDRELCVLVLNFNELSMMCGGHNESKYDITISADNKLQWKDAKTASIISSERIAEHCVREAVNNLS